jgi:hypothetical protein
MKPAISALLLLFFTAIITFYVVYPWMMSLVQRMKTFPGELLYVDPGNTTINATCITLSVRNLGAKQISITAANINHQPYTLGINQAVPPQTVATMYLYGDYEQKKEYAVELICDNGYVQTYTVKNG